MNLLRRGTSLSMSNTADSGRARVRLPLIVRRLLKRAVLSIGISLALGGTASAAQPDHAAYRAALVDLMHVVRDVHMRARADAPGSRTQIERAAKLFEGFSDRQIDVLAVSLPEVRLRAVVTQARRLLDAQPRSRGKTVIVAQPDVTPAFCTD
jgi:hypothetical protein